MPRKEADGKNYVKYEVIGNSSVAVPTHFYKVIVSEVADGTLEMESYVMPNQVIDDSTPLSVFMVIFFIAKQKINIEFSPFVTGSSRKYRKKCWAFVL